MNYGLITKSLSENEITDEQLNLINTYTRRPLTKEEVFIFSLNLCDNEVDRDFERFSVASLNALADLMLGKTGIFDHNSKAENQAARIFHTEVISSDEETSTGEPHHTLKAYAYMLKSAKNSDLILEIDAGIKKEVSISCAVSKILCSICQSDVKVSPCEHKKGIAYTENGFSSICHHILDEPTDAYEWSFVAVPAQKSAGVTKSYQSTSPCTPYEPAQIDELAQIGREYKESLRKEFIKLSGFAHSGINCSIVDTASKKLSVDELREFNKFLCQKSDKVIPSGFQLFSEEVSNEPSNNHFKI